MTFESLPTDALERLLAERGWLVRLAHALVRDPATADDLAQETWLAAVRSPPASSAHPRAWLATVLRRMAARRARGASRRELREEAAAAAERQTLDPAAALERAELRRRIGNAVMDLPDPYRTTVVLRWFEERSVAEIAAELGESEAAIRSRLRRALERLRGRLDEDHDGKRAAWCLPLLAWLDAARPPAPVPATAGTGTLATLGGAALMTAKVKVSAAVVAVVVLVAWSISALGPENGHVEPRRVADGGSAAGAVMSAERSTDRRTRRGAADEESNAAAATTDVPPDRDRDVHGEVVDGRGDPVAGAQIVSLDAAGRRVWLPGDPAAEERPEGPSTTTAKDGSFRLRLDPGQVVDLRVSADGFAELEMPHVAAGERVRITLRAGVGLVVTVTDARGEPVEGAEVVARRGPNTPDVAFRRTATTDDGGRAQFEGLPPGVRANVLARHRRHGVPPLVWVDLPRRGDAEAVVVLPAGRTVRGSVVSARDDSPLVGASVGTALRPDATRTVAGGGFELTGVPIGAAVVDASAPGHAPARLEVGPAADDVLLRLPVACVLVGRVVDPEGAAVAGARVSGQVWHRGPSGTSAYQADAFAVAGPEGRFELDGLPGDRVVTLVLRADGLGRTLHRVLPLDDPPGRRDLGDVAMQPSVGLDLEVVWAGDDPAGRVSVSLSGSNLERDARRGVPATIGSLERRRTDDLGRVRFDGLAPGAYVLTVAPSGAEEVQRGVTLTAGRHAERVELTAGPELVVRVTDDDGELVSGTYVSATDGNRAILRAQTDGSGVARFRPGPRPWIVDVPQSTATQAGWLPPGPTPVPDGQREIDVVLTRGATWTARLVQPDGRPLASAHVHCTVRNGGRWSGLATTCLSGDDGSIAWTIPPGARIDARLTGIARGSLQDIQSGRGDRELPWEGAWTGLAAESEHTLHVTALVGASLRVRVTTPDGAPVPGVGVVTRVGSRLVRDDSVTTDAEGRAVLEGLPARERGVEVVLDGAKLPAGDWLDPAPVRATPGSDEVVLQLRPAAAISGRLVRADGEPLDYGGVEVRHGDDLIGQATAHGDGRFRVLVPRDAPGPLTVSGFTYDRARNRHVGSTSGVWAGGEDVVIELTPER